MSYDDATGGYVHMDNNATPDWAKKVMRDLAKKQVEDGTTTDVAFNFIDEIDGLKYKYIYTINKDKIQFETEDVCNNIIDGINVNYHKFESLYFLFNVFHNLKYYLMCVGMTDLDETEIHLNLKDCGHSRLISSEKEYYQLPIKYDMPILCRGVRYIDVNKEFIIVFNVLPLK